MVPGGRLSVAWGADDRVRMTGPAELEHEGVLPEAIGAGGE